MLSLQVAVLSQSVVGLETKQVTKVKKCFTMIRIICFGSYLDINIHMYAVVHLSLVNMIVLGVKYVSCVTLMSLV